MAPRTFAIAVPAQACNLKMVRAFFECALQQAGATGVDEVLLALDEACANVVRHRGGAVDDGLIRVRGEFSDDQIRLRIGRFCEDCDVAKIKPRDLADIRPGGLGTSFIARIMDRVEFEREPRHPSFMALVMTRALRPDEAER